MDWRRRKFNSRFICRKIHTVIGLLFYEPRRSTKRRHQKTCISAPFKNTSVPRGSATRVLTLKRRKVASVTAAPLNNAAYIFAGAIMPRPRASLLAARISLDWKFRKRFHAGYDGVGTAPRREGSRETAIVSNAAAMSDDLIMSVLACWPRRLPIIN